jgi:hypothetical protein
LSLFANSHQPLNDAEFLLKTLAAVEHQLRLRTRYRIAATPWLVHFSVALFGGLAPMPIGLLLAHRNGLRWPR